MGDRREIQDEHVASQPEKIVSNTIDRSVTPGPSPERPRLSTAKIEDILKWRDGTAAAATATAAARQKPSGRSIGVDRPTPSTASADKLSSSFDEDGSYPLEQSEPAQNPTAFSGGLGAPQTAPRPADEESNASQRKPLKDPREGGTGAWRWFPPGPREGKKSIGYTLPHSDR